MLINGSQAGNSRRRQNRRTNISPIGQSARPALNAPRNHKIGERSLDLTKWGLIPHQ